MVRSSDLLQLGVYFAALLLMAPFIGKYMARVFQGESIWLTPVLAPLERLIYRFSGVNAQKSMNWKQYAFSLMIFNLLGFLVVFALQLWQSHLPLNPQKLPDVPLLLALNTAVSFMTNTNWQAYSGESTLSYLVQLLGLNVQNFVSAATGFAALLALIRGLLGRGSEILGNFWVDLTRATLYVLLPFSIIFALLFVSQGVVQSFSEYKEVKTIEVQKHAVRAIVARPDQNGHPAVTVQDGQLAVTTQLIPLGPAASQIAIKQPRMRARLLRATRLCGKYGDLA